MSQIASLVAGNRHSGVEKKTVLLFISNNYNYNTLHLQFITIKF